MKKVSVETHAQSWELPQLNKILNQPLDEVKEEISKAYLQPTEELICNLNRIGQEYPFCVYYKEKKNDPL